MPKVEIYTKDWCPFCGRAKAHLQSKGVDYDEIDVTHDTARELEMVKRSRQFTVPQIFIDSRHLGGSDDLLDADRNGQLDRLLGRDEKGAAA